MATANEDLVNRRFEADGPNQLWVADASYAPMWTGTIDLAIALAVWSHEIVGGAIEDHRRTELKLDALNMALEQKRPKRVIHHSDYGRQYTRHAFGKRCQEMNAMPSMGTADDAYDNALGESVFASLEKELLKHPRFNSKSEARMALFEWIEGWYDPRRSESFRELPVQENEQTTRRSTSPVCGRYRGVHQPDPLLRPLQRPPLSSGPRVRDAVRGVLRRPPSCQRGRGLNHDDKSPRQSASSDCGGRPRFGCTINADRRDQHQQPPRQINSSQKKSVQRSGATPVLLLENFTPVCLVPQGVILGQHGSMTAATSHPGTIRAMRAKKRARRVLFNVVLDTRQPLLLHRSLHREAQLHQNSG